MTTGNGTAVGIAVARSALGAQELPDTPDERAERVLDEAGLVYEYRVIDLAHIDPKASRENRGRVSPLDYSLIEQYAQQMRSGSKFPAICVREVRRSGNCKYVIAGGNHRAAAMLECGRTSALALVCVSTDAEFEIVARRLNIVEGKSLDTDDRLLLAADMVTNRGVTQAIAAAIHAVSTSALGDYIRRAKAEAIACANGINTTAFRNIPRGKVTIISTFSDSPPVLVAMALAAIGVKGGSIEEFKSLADEVRSAGTEQQKRDICKGYITSCGGSKTLLRQAASSQARTRFLGNITRLEKVLKAQPSMRELHIDEQERPELRKRLELLARMLTNIENG